MPLVYVYVYTHTKLVAFVCFIAFICLSKFVCVLCVSGGHLNPAVTLGMFIAGGVNVLAAGCYVVVQVLGGILGAAFVLVCYQYHYFHTP